MKTRLTLPCAAPSAATDQRPGLRAYEDSVRLPFPELVSVLREILGVRLRHAFHADISAPFDLAHSTYRLCAAELEQVLRDHFGDELEELIEETDIREEPRRLDEIQAAEKELLDRIWYDRSLQADYRQKREGDAAEVTRSQEVSAPGRACVQATYIEPGQLGPCTDFMLGTTQEQNPKLGITRL